MAPGCRLGPEASKRTGSNPPLTGLRGSLSCRRPHSPAQSEGFNKVMLAVRLAHGYSCSRTVCRMDGYTDVRSPAPAVSRPPMRTVTVEVPVSVGRKGGPDSAAACLGSTHPHTCCPRSSRSLSFNAFLIFCLSHSWILYCSTQCPSKGLSVPQPCASPERLNWACGEGMGTEGPPDTGSAFPTPTRGVVFQFPGRQDHLPFKNSWVWLRVPEQPVLSAH